MARFKQETSRKTVLVKAVSDEGCTVEVCPPCNTWAPLRRAKHLQAAVPMARCASVSAPQSTWMKVNKPSYPSNASRSHCKATHHHMPRFDEQISPKQLFLRHQNSHGRDAYNYFTILTLLTTPWVLKSWAASLRNTGQWWIMDVCGSFLMPYHYSYFCPFKRWWQFSNVLTSLYLFFFFSINVLPAGCII